MSAHRSDGVFIIEKRAVRIKEFRIMGLSINDSVYSCVFFSLTGLHFFHLVVGLLLLGLSSRSCSFLQEVLCQLFNIYFRNYLMNFVKRFIYQIFTYYSLNYYINIFIVYISFILVLYLFGKLFCILF